MKTKLSIVLFALLLTTSVYSQITVDPSHNFYSTVQGWYNRGIVNKIPPVRPYPTLDIKEILNTVLDCQDSTELDIELANSYLQELNSKPWNLDLKTEYTYDNKNYTSDYLLNIIPSVNGNLNLFNDCINIGYQAGFSIRNQYNISDFVANYQNFNCDARYDPATVGNFGIYLNVNDVVSFSKNGFIIQAGISRQGYGDFLDEGLALNDQAFHRPYFSLSYLNNFLSYTQQLSILGATVNKTSTSPKDIKYLAFHAIELKPLKWLSASFYETSVFGKRFDFSYLLPVPFMVGQSFSGYAASLMMGVRLKLTPVKNFALKTDIFIDDLAVNELVKLNWNSKNRIAWNTGLEYTPVPKFIESLGINFLMITPYTYSHWDVDDAVTETMSSSTINYQSYTNCGYTIGSTLPPNSEQIKINLTLTPLRNLKIKMYASYMEHANIVETLTDQEKMVYLLANSDVYSTDGSINTHPYMYDQSGYWESLGNSTNHTYIPSAWDFMNFLNQAHKLTDIQAGITVDYQVFKKKFGSLSLNIGYTFESILNKGVDSDIFPGGCVTFNSENNEFTYQMFDTAKTKVTTTDISEILNYYTNYWVSKFTNQFNHFVTIGFEYKY